MDDEREERNDEELEIDPSLVAVNDSMLEGLGHLADYFGFNKVMGQLYGALLLNPKPLSLDDLVERLGKSKASVSMNMRTLEHMGIVREVWIRDSRKKYYEAESDLWKIVTNVLGSRELRDIDRALTVLETNIARLREKMPEMDVRNKNIATYYIDRCDQLSDLFRFARWLLTSILEYGRDFDFNGFIIDEPDKSDLPDRDNDSPDKPNNALLD
jgi:DNA-binding transcriptional regulator GbsR (MarR family)